MLELFSGLIFSLTNCKNLYLLTIYFLDVTEKYLYDCLSVKMLCF